MTLGISFLSFLLLLLHTLGNFAITSQDNNIQLISNFTCKSSEEFYSPRRFLLLLLLFHIYSVDLTSCTCDSLNNRGVRKPSVVDNLFCGIDT